jgi:hypothetical protein
MKSSVTQSNFQRVLVNYSGNAFNPRALPNMKKINQKNKPHSLQWLEHLQHTMWRAYTGHHSLITSFSTIICFPIISATSAIRKPVEPYITVHNIKLLWETSGNRQTLIMFPHLQCKVRDGTLLENGYRSSLTSII